MLKSNLNYGLSFLTENVIEAIDGFLLGDEGINDSTNSGHVARFQCGVQYKEFAQYMMSFFNPYSPSVTPYINSSMSSGICYNGRTCSHPDIYSQYFRWYVNDYDKKQPPDDVRITPLSVMIWYLGDGSLVKTKSSITIRLSTDGFDKEKNEMLVEKLKYCGIKSKVNSDNRIRINNNSISDFFNFIGRSSPIGCYQYKFDLPIWRLESKRMSIVAKEIGVNYNKLSYWVKNGFVPCLRTSEKARPRFLTEHILKIKEYIEFDKNNSKTEKTSMTNFKKYGVDNVFQSEEIKEKIKQSHMKKYGVDHHMKNDIVKNKMIKTLMEKYGVDNIAKDISIQEKMKNTNKDRYGFDNPMRNEDIAEKSKILHQEVVEYNINNNYDLINILRNDEFWQKMKMEKYTLNELCIEYNLNYGSLTNRLVSDEFYKKYYECYSFPKQQKQKKIFDILVSLGLHPIMNDRSVISPLELDIYIPDKKIAIEFNGSYWHSEACLSSIEARNKHINKLKLCRDKGIRLFNIFENTWDDRSKQYLNLIKSVLGLNSINIGARKCKIDENICKDFYDEYHIQGYGRGTIKSFNLMYDNKIVASISASHHHRQNTNKRNIVLNRLCFKDNYNVQGGASKLFGCLIKWAKKEMYHNIISFSDNCWTNGNIYNILGFDFVKEYGPDYFYWDIKKRCYRSKQSQKKSNTGCLKNQTERDWCKENGLFRIYDCGKKVWNYEL